MIFFCFLPLEPTSQRSAGRSHPKYRNGAERLDGARRGAILRRKRKKTILRSERSELLPGHPLVQRPFRSSGPVAMFSAGFPALIPSISDCKPRRGFGKRLDGYFNYQTRFLKEYCFSWPAPLPISLPICPISQARSAEALFRRDRTRRRSVAGRIGRRRVAHGSLCEKRRNYVSCELAY